ncbi:putative competence protein [Dinoroseobacter shibae DFL 12 = DSM 16493]|uniref:Putative competence protein n=1 Tax=Dinoroseobacter shibae (strain DSM 16493 / NCIMB 14021 / DFL 12) TaxID=398580 RepID=A8LMK1_DINSH|nr:ComEC/Rec2 family competence protein [Dinoroseobacter shibae]ABV93546.1 putative competence protein [Dinoroseobacter shibae DFL 12 = DSM 16493]URF48457.1 ComEC family competence protein [Dinoroseobacter shibae]URF52767.1 ComEC family competence protein [Dinoroseobacter shibae]
MTQYAEVRQVLFPWAPVVLGCGMLAYFLPAGEPSLAVLRLVWSCAAFGLLWGLFAPWSLRPLGWALALAAGGYGLAAWRTADVAASVLPFRYYGPIEGRIVEIDSSYAGAMRLTLADVRLEDVAPDRRPAQVRVSLHGPLPEVPLRPGQVVMTTGHLSPPNAPVEPGGFDFRRHAWFEGLGAVGYTRVPVVLWAEPAQLSFAERVYETRLKLSKAIRDRIAGQPGAFASAIITGDRAAIDRAHVEDLRGSNLAHLLAISGLHMGLLTGTVFLGLRSLMALWPWLALRVPVKKVAAVCALGAAVVYLFISGMSVATERAFIMVAMILVGVCFDRRALSLRSVAWAALLVLALRPEAVLGPGFQMSFAATTALVITYAHLRDVRWWRGIPKWAKGTASLLLSSAVAGAATAPIAAAHFNIVGHYGLIANLASVPVMGTLVMPGALVALAGVPLGLEGVGLFAMEVGIRWILWVAGTVAGLEGAVGHVVRPMPVVLPLIVLGALVVGLLPWRARWAGLAPVVLALGLWTQSDRPELLISDTGGLLGVMTEQGRALSKGRGDGFAARNWLENDGDGVTQDVAAARAGIEAGKGTVSVALGPYRVIQLRGKTGAAQFPEACATADLVVANTRLPRSTGACESIDAWDLRRTGALAVSVTEDGLQVVRAKSAEEQRMWTGAARATTPGRLARAPGAEPTR